MKTGLMLCAILPLLSSSLFAFSIGEEFDWDAPFDQETPMFTHHRTLTPPTESPGSDAGFARYFLQREEPPAGAPAPAPWPHSRDYWDTIGFGVGFTSAPTTFLLSGDVGFRINNCVTIGPFVQLGMSDDEFLFSGTLNLRYTFEVDQARLDYELEPYIQGGAGFLFLNEDPGNGADERDDVGFMIQAGGGVDYWISAGTAIGTQINLNFMPEDVLDENFFFSWQVLTLRFLF